MAYPALGDRVEYQAFWEQDPVVMTKEVISQDAESGLYRVHTLTTFRNQILQDQTVDLPKSFLYTPEKIKDVMRTCESREGALGLEKIDGKMLKVCEFYNEDSQLTNILGPVPFGLIRFQVYIGGEDFLDFHATRVRAGAKKNPDIKFLNQKS